MLDAPPGLTRLALTQLPQITYFERDGGPYITAGVFLANDPDSGIPTCRSIAAQIIGDHELRIRLGSSHHLAQYQAKAEARGEALEAAIMIGAPPALVLAAAAPLAYDEDEWGWRRKSPARPDAAPLPDRCPRCTRRNGIVIEGRFLPGCGGRRVRSASSWASMCCRRQSCVRG